MGAICFSDERVEKASQQIRISRISIAKIRVYHD